MPKKASPITVKFRSLKVMPNESAVMAIYETLRTIQLEQPDTATDSQKAWLIERLNYYRSAYGAFLASRSGATGVSGIKKMCEKFPGSDHTALMWESWLELAKAGWDALPIQLIEEYESPIGLWGCAVIECVMISLTTDITPQDPPPTKRALREKLQRVKRQISGNEEGVDGRANPVNPTYCPSLFNLVSVAIVTEKKIGNSRRPDKNQVRDDISGAFKKWERTIAKQCSQIKNLDLLFVNLDGELSRNEGRRQVRVKNTGATSHFKMPPLVGRNKLGLKVTSTSLAPHIS